MSAELIALVVIGGLVVMLLAGVEVGVAMGVVSSLAFFFFLGKEQIEVPWSAWRTLDSFTLVAMPLFIFMGSVLSYTGAVKSLFIMADRWLSALPGGLVSAAVVASAFFGAMSGSSVAAAATFSTITLPEMEKRNYDRKLSVGAIAAAGGLSVLIPPSIVFIIYGAYTNQSIAQLFAAGLIPGIVLTVLYLITILIMVTIAPRRAPRIPVTVTWTDRFVSLKDVAPWLLFIIFVLGAIFGGIMTATEASALGAVLALIVAACYRSLNYKAVRDSFLSAVKVTGMIGLVVVTGTLLAFVMNAAGLTKVFADFMTALPFGKWGVFVVICILYFILGCFFDTIAMLLLTIPFILPVISALGFDPIWFGVVFVVLAEMGLITPPFGLNLFTIHGVMPRYSILEIAWGALPFLIPMGVEVLLLALFPQMALWLPSLLY